MFRKTLERVGILRHRSASWIFFLLITFCSIAPLSCVVCGRKGVSRRTRYAVLGDDNCITDQKVQVVYASLLDDFSVSFFQYLNKNTLDIHSGCIEFAKRFLVNELMLYLN